MNFRSWKNEHVLLHAMCWLPVYFVLKTIKDLVGRHMQLKLSSYWTAGRFVLVTWLLWSRLTHNRWGGAVWYYISRRRWWCQGGEAPSPGGQESQESKQRPRSCKFIVARITAMSNTTQQCRPRTALWPPWNCSQTENWICNKGKNTAGC